MDPSQAASPRPQITVVESPGCHSCDDARQAITELARTYPFAVRTLDVTSADGPQLMAAHRAALSPLVLLDGVFFSHGRLPRRKLERVLARRDGVRSAS